MTSHHPVDRGWAWMCTLGAAIALFWVNGTIRSLGMLQVEFVEHYEATSMLVALLMSTICVGMSLVAPIASAIGHKFTYRSVMLTGSVFCSLAYFLCAFAPNFYYILATFGVLSGVGYGCIFAPCLVVIMQYFQKRVALATGLTMAGGSLGMLVVPVLFRHLLDTYGLFGCLLLMSGCIMHMIPATALLRPTSFYHRDTVSKQKSGRTSGSDINQLQCKNTKPTHISENTNSATAYKPTGSGDGGPAEVELCKMSDCRSPSDDLSVTYINGGTPQVTTPLTTTPTSIGTTPISDTSETTDANEPSASCCVIWPKNLKQLCEQLNESIDWSLFKNALFLTYVGGVSLSSASWSGTMLFLPMQSKHVGISKNEVVVLVAVWGVADLITRPAIGWFSDLNILKPSYIFCIAMVIGGIATGVYVYVTSYTVLIVLSLMIGLSVGVYSALMAPLLNTYLDPACIHSAFGLCLLVQGLFNMVLITLLGIINDSTGSCHATFIICAVLMISSGLLMASQTVASRYVAASSSAAGSVTSNTAAITTESQERQA